MVRFERRTDAGFMSSERMSEYFAVIIISSLYMSLEIAPLLLAEAPRLLFLVRAFADSRNEPAVVRAVGKAGLEEGRQRDVSRVEINARMI